MVIVQTVVGAASYGTVFALLAGELWSELWSVVKLMVSQARDEPDGVGVIIVVDSKGIRGMFPGMLPKGNSHALLKISERELSLHRTGL